MSAGDPWTDRLSEYLDGELGADERAALEAHLAGCARCTEVLADLRALVAAARALPDRAPVRDLWPAIERGLERAAPRAGRRSRAALVAAFAAGVLAALAGARALGRGAASDGERVARGDAYLLLLHEPAGFGAGMDADEHAQVVERYSRWARELGERCVAGDELAPDGVVLAPGAEPADLPEGARVGGYFLVEVSGEREALALARTCPHLEQGGWIELRRIRQH